jgi:hypothetical protein
VADHLVVKQERERSMKVLRESPRDGGIITEGGNRQPVFSIATDAPSQPRQAISLTLSAR